MPEKKESFENVPASVLKQQAEAEAKMKSLKEGGEPKQPIEHQEPLRPTHPDPVKQTPAEPVKDPVPAAQPAINPAIESSTWEHKYRVLQGKYNKEMEELKGQILEMKGMVERQQKVIEDLGARKQQPAAQSQINIEELSPEQFEGWGDEIKTLVRTVNAQNKLIKEQAAVIDSLKTSSPAQSSTVGDQELRKRVEDLEVETNDTRANAYLKYLDDNIKGDWKAVNVDPNFSKWLDEIDPLTLSPRRDILLNAAQNLRGANVASIFNQYILSNKVQGGVSVADALPQTAGNGGFEEGAGKGKEEVSLNDLKTAEQDFIKGRISEADYNKISNKYQAQLRKAQR